ncbi:MAG: ribosome small subunit-dependent GTPase A [Bacteroidetes bacterium]|nr:ribosome small subunit-dependent GTPase A [Bacteroidota bacterium]
MGSEREYREIKHGIVFRSTGSYCTVRFDDGSTAECKVRGRFRIEGIKTTNPVAVGDKVDVGFAKNEETGFLFRIHRRANYIIRKSTKLSKQSHIIAANIDEAFLIATLVYPRTSTGFIDRFLVTAEAYRIPTTIVFNKFDIYTDDQKNALTEWIKMYGAASYRCLETSALTGFQIDTLHEYTKDKVSLFSGHSGVGKSAVINALDPRHQLKTGELSRMHSKGKHTTTFAEMHELNYGGFLIDTPGIKEFGLIDVEKEELTHFFPEMFALLPKCKYYNCTHFNEPDCAVIQAVENGKIHPERYKNYLNILNDVDEEPDEWD